MYMGKHIHTYYYTSNFAGMLNCKCKESLRYDYDIPNSYVRPCHNFSG